jgi:hypothetical protein
MCTDTEIVRVIAVSIAGQKWQHFLYEVWTNLIDIVESFATYIRYSLLKEQAFSTQKCNRQIIVKINLPVISVICKQNGRDRNW